MNDTTKKIGAMTVFVYCCGQFGGNVLNMVFGGWIQFFYTDGTGGRQVLVPIATMSLILGVGRVLDAFVDPTVGYLSDKTRTRIGRRRPYMFVGVPIMVIAFIMLFKPLFPAQSTQLIISTAIISTVFWFAFTASMGPFLGLMPEIATTPSDRTKVSTFMAVAMLLATAYQGIAVSKMVGKTSGNDSFFKMAVLSGIICFVFFYITAIFIREKKEPAQQHHEEHYSFVSAFLWTFKNKAFVIFILSSVFQLIGFASLTASIPFIVTRLMHQPLSFVANIYLINIPCFIISFLIVNILTKKVGNVRFYKISLFLLSALLPLLFLIGHKGIPISPVVLGLGLMGLLSFPIAANMVLPMAILADIVDFDEKKTGFRREAMYFGMQGMLQKAATALSLVMQGAVFAVFGYSYANPLGITLIGPIAGVLGLIGFAVFLAYPLTDDVVKKMRASTESA